MEIWRRIALLAFLVSAVSPVLFRGRSELINEDSSAYQDLADSLRHGHYEFDSRPQVVYPPGFPLVLSVWGSVVGRSNASYLLLVGLLSFAGLLAAWRALRMDVGQVAALTACLLLACSPVYFLAVSRTILADTLYLLVSSLAILFARRLDSLKETWGNTLALAAITPGVVLIRTAGYSWVGGLCLWLILSACFERSSAKRRARMAGPALASGLLAVLAWQSWTSTHQPVPDFQEQPETYLSLAAYRNPRDTDLGKVALWELPIRGLDQAGSDASSAFALLLRPIWVSPAFYSVPVAASFFLCGLGLVSLVRQRGLQAVDCYFVCYWMILAAWPFDAASRYVVPVLPLCLMYGWCGIREFQQQAFGGPLVRLLGAFSAVIAAGGLLSLVSGHTASGKQNLVSVALWIAFAAGCWMWRNGSVKIPLTSLRALAVIAAVGILITDAVETIAIARENINQFDGSIIGSSRGWAVAGVKVAAVSRPSDVVMTDLCYIVHRWSQRRCVRFPPTRSVKVILDAIQKNHVSWLVVGPLETRYQPPDRERIRLVEKAVPGLLQEVQETEDYRLYRLESTSLSTTLGN